MVMETALIFLLFNGEDGSRCGVWCGSWYQGSMCIVQCAAIWMDTILETTPSIHRIVIVRGAISSKTKVMFRTRTCKQSLLIVSRCYIRVQAMMIAIEEFRFQGRVETHIIWDAPALVTASCSGTTCDICVHWETATFNSNVTWD